MDSSPKRWRDSKLLAWFPWWEKIDAAWSLVRTTVTVVKKVWGVVLTIGSFFGLSFAGFLRFIGAIEGWPLTVGAAIGAAVLGIASFVVLGVVMARRLTPLGVDPRIAQLEKRVEVNRWRTGPPIAPSPKELAAASHALSADDGVPPTVSGTPIPAIEQIAYLGDQIAQLKKDREEERAELKKKHQKLQSELQAERQERDHERAAHQQTQARATALFNELQYGITVQRRFASIDEMDLRPTHNGIIQMRDSLTAAGRGALDLVFLLGNDMGTGDDQRNRVIGRYFGEHRYNPTERLFDRLCEELDAVPPADYRKWLVDYYEAYNELRRMIMQMAKFLDRSLIELDAYKQWRVHDATFLEEVKNIGIVYDFIKAINQDHRYPLVMPGD